MKGPEQFIENQKTEGNTELNQPDVPEHLQFADHAEQETAILTRFTPEQQEEIRKKQQMLSSLVYFIGKDFDMPVILNQPGGGWYWDQTKNHVKADAKDLLEKPIQFLRFVISHEAGHRRISRITGVIPKKVWQQPGFSFMSNAIEDGRDNNFVAEAYPKFREQMVFSYDLQEKERLAQEKAQKQLGYRPKSILAGFEFLRQWFREAKGEEFKIDESLPPDVQEVVKNTLAAAQDSWLRYPSRQEADQSEEIITKYAAASFKINHEKVWPEFKKLVDKDIEQEKLEKALQKALSDQIKKKIAARRADKNKPKEVFDLPPELRDKLTPEEQEELKKGINELIDEMANKEIEPEQPEGEPVTIDLDSLSDELKEAIKDYIESLPEDVRKEIGEMAVRSFTEFERAVGEELEGKLVSTPDEETGEESEVEGQEPEPPAQSEEKLETDLTDLQAKIDQAINKTEGVYEQYQSEVIELINDLEIELRDIFVARRAHRFESGFKSGKRIDIKRRIQEKAKGVSAAESRAWERRDLPEEKDYAFELLVDLSGSMQGKKIKETMKALIVITEVLNRLSISAEILGFNRKLVQYQEFNQTLSKEIRDKIGGMLRAVRGGDASYNDDGWAVGEASKRLGAQKAAEKFLIVLSDGQPAPSAAHSGKQYDLRAAVQKIAKETDQKIIGLGIGKGTQHVKRYYPNNVANVGVDEMAKTLSGVIREAIANY